MNQARSEEEEKERRDRKDRGQEADRRKGSPTKEKLELKQRLYLPAQLRMLGARGIKLKGSHDGGSKVRVPEGPRLSHDSHGPFTHPLFRTNLSRDDNYVATNYFLDS